MNKTLFYSNRGYTFIELLIAITVLGLIISASLMMFSGSYLSINNAGNRSKAITLCRQQMESIKALGYDSALYLYSPANVNANTIEENINGFPSFKRVTKVSPYLFSCTNNPGIEVDLLLIEITVSWDESKTERQESLQGLLSNR